MSRIKNLWMKLPFMGKMAIVAGIAVLVTIILVLIISPPWQFGEIAYP